MKKKSIILAIAAFSVILITAVSFLVLKKVPETLLSARKTDKAEVIYGRAEEFLKAGEYHKAADILLIIVSRYPDSIYAERSLRKLASICLARSDYVKAKYYYDRLLKDFPRIKDAGEIRSAVEGLNMKMMQSPVMTADSIEYVVQPGNTLIAIAKKFNTTVELVKMMNGLQNDIIRPGQKLKINISKFSIYIDRFQNILILRKDGEPFRTYSIATGKDNSTPLGNFAIVDKMVRPPWTKPGVGIVLPDSDEYELGERWMPLSIHGYGIHGTNDDSSIGRQATAGCVRMHNSDVIELYDMVTKGTAVEIVDSREKTEGKVE
ncbi:MAG: hypothetical protein DRP85_03980 [Candidatus Makaraimicrobium thalassicum]|nr:MAG: hypothetical protein DRP85_03980 [Candidatus Omnitrophota bacterium]